MATPNALINATTLVLLAMAMVCPRSQAITCGSVVQTIIPCLNYLKNGGGIPPVCCDGIRSLNSVVKGVPDRQKACVCIKQAAQAYNVNYGFANSLPGKCGVNLGIQITPNVDCSRVH